MDRLTSNEKKIKSLITKHQYFENLISEAFKSRSIDNLVITDLKKKKIENKRPNSGVEINLINLFLSFRIL